MCSHCDDMNVVGLDNREGTADFVCSTLSTHPNPPAPAAFVGWMSILKYVQLENIAIQGHITRELCSCIRVFVAFYGGVSVAVAVYVQCSARYAELCYIHVYLSLFVCIRIVHLPSGGGVAVLSRALYLTPYARAQYSKGALDYFYLSEESRPFLRAASAFVC